MKTGKRNEWQMYTEEHINDLDGFIVPHNRVLMEMDPDANEKTVGGIITIKEMDYAGHAVRWGTVKKLPKRLYCQLKDPTSMPWECDIDVLPGDKVLMTYQDSNYGYPFWHGDKYHKLISYDGIILAKRENEIIMCNGYLLFEKVYETLRAGSYEKIVEDKRWGIVVASGKPNRRRKDYDMKRKSETLVMDSQVDLVPGDKVFIEDPTRVFDLEDFSHASFDNRKIYKVASRRRLGAVLSQD